MLVLNLAILSIFSCCFAFLISTYDASNDSLAVGTVSDPNALTSGTLCEFLPFLLVLLVVVLLVLVVSL